MKIFYWIVAKKSCQAVRAAFPAVKQWFFLVWALARRSLQP
jgi:hypothetical protein